MKKWILISLLALSITGCGKAEDDELEVGVEDADTRAYPFTLKSCSDEATGAPTDSLKEASADFGVFSFRWYGNKIVKIKTLTLKLRGSSLAGNEFKKVFGGTELEDTFFGTTMTIPAAVENVTPTLFTTGCSIRIGGISFKDPKVAGFATGTITLFGEAVDDEGKEVVIATTDISVKYDGNGGI